MFFFLFNEREGIPDKWSGSGRKYKSFNNYPSQCVFFTWPVFFFLLLLVILSCLPQLLSCLKLQSQLCNIDVLVNCVQFNYDAALTLDNDAFYVKLLIKVTVATAAESLPGLMFRVPCRIQKTLTSTTFR